MKELIRFAHIEGYTDVTYSDDGQNIITCGSDGDYRIWNGFEDDDPACIRVGDEATCIAFQKGKVYVGTDMHALQIYSVSDNQPDGIVSRFTANITHISINRDGSKIAAGSCDMTIKVKDLGSKNDRELVLEGHTAPILSVNLDPKSEFLVSSSCDGTVRLWSLQSKKQINSWSWAPRSNDFSNSPTLCRMQFEPTTGRFLAVPVSQNNESMVKIIERGSWKEVAQLKDERMIEVSICAWSPCGKFLAAAAKGGHIFVWDMNPSKRNVIFHYTHEKSPHLCSLAWNPKPSLKEIAFCDSRGHLGLLENVTKDSASSESSASSSSRAVSSESAFQTTGEDDDNDVDISITQIKKATGFEVNEEDGQDVFTGVRPGIMDIDSIMDEMNSKSSRAPSPSSVSRKPMQYGPPCKLQEPFQPGSSPAHLQNRYMVWNNVGIVRCYEEDASGENSIDVEFHDTSVHHALHIPNGLGHTMAALSTQALLLACPAQDDNPSKLVCVHFASWDGHKEWSTSLPEGEEAVALAVGDSWVAVATSRRLLRLFTVSGLQRAVLSLAGQVVCIVGHGSKIILTFHYGIGAPGDQAIGFALVNIDRKSPIGYEWVVNPQPLPMGPGSFLSWAGFTDEGTAATMDSAGLLQMFFRGSWIPLLDTKQHVKGKSDSYFIVGLSEMEQTVRCILCKGARYPPTLPRPNMNILEIRLPLCDVSNEKTQQEETLIRSSMLLVSSTDLDQQGWDVFGPKDKAERSLKESLMKMFALACQSDREVRAVEVAEWMNNEQLLQLAVKYATRARKRHLGDRLTALAEQLVREAQEDLEEEIREDHSASLSNRSRNSNYDCNSQQDMFASSAHSQEASVIESNPILQAKQQQQQRQTAQTDAPKTIRPLTQNKKNPFAKKTQDSPAGTPPSARGVAIFDEIKPSPIFKSKGALGNAKENQQSAKPKNTKQSTLFSMKKSVASATTSEESTPTASATPSSDGSASQKTGFMLWLEQNQSILQEEHPEASDSELTRLAAQRFRALPEAERQKYSRKRKASEEGTDSPDGKRNRPTQAQKLAAFAAEADE